MRTGGLFILFLLGAIIYGLYKFSTAKEKTIDAKQTAAFIIIYPIILNVMMNNIPVELWIAIPVVFAGIPWLFAGIHLSQVADDPSITTDDEFVGLPKKVWGWGGVAAFIMGIAFN